jgi:hypothetical protein
MHDGGVHLRYLGAGRDIPVTFRQKIPLDLAAAMPRHQVSGYFELKSHILTDSHHIAIGEQSGRCVALMGASDQVAAGRPFTYIETLLVSERHQRAALAPALVATLFDGVMGRLGGFPDLVAMKTYTPRAYVLMRRFTGGPEVGFYPDTGGRNSASDIRLAAQLAAFLAPDCEFRAETGVLAGGGGKIGSNFWPEEPLTDDEIVNRFFRKEVCFSDRVLCIVRAQTPTAKQAIVEKLAATKADRSRTSQLLDPERQGSR